MGDRAWRAMIGQSLHIVGGKSDLRFTNFTKSNLRQP